MSNSNWYLIALITGYTACIIYLGFVPTQSDFSAIIIPYSIAFFIYVLIIQKEYDWNYLRGLLGLAIGLRFVLIFAFPNLSDDIFRFIWDGRCIHNGLSPFEYTPREIMGQFSGLDNSLIVHLNSPDYHSIYPPVGQLLSYFATFASSENYYLESLLLKCFTFAAEIGSLTIGIKLLRHLGQNVNRILLYALNPLIIIEIMGNIHFEGFMILFVLLSLWLLLRSQIARSGLATSLGVASKILPLMLLPLYAALLRGKKGLVYLSTVLVFVLLLYSPFFSKTDILSLSGSLDLYIKKFEFNGGIYYFLRWLGYTIKGFNTIHIIGPILSVSIVILISYQAIYFHIKKLRFDHLIPFCLLAFTTYLLLATTVHPWYLSMPVALCIFTKFRFPIVWSFLIFFTYVNYSYPEYHENLWVVGIEYLVVYSIIIYEILKHVFNFIPYRWEKSSPMHDLD